MKLSITLTMKAVALFSVFSAAMAMPAANQAANVPLVTFDGNPGTSFNFTEYNTPTSWPTPPISSKATWNVTGGHGALDGEVAVEWDPPVGVGPGGWPGMFWATAEGDFPDASTAFGGALVLMVRSSTPDYTGFHVSLGTTEKWKTTQKACGSDLGPYKNRGCYKAPFMVPAGDEFVPVRIPFSSFSGMWLYGPGNIYHTCSKDKDACVTPKTLASIKSIAFWAEGEAGKVHLEVMSITASTSAGTQ